MHPRLSVTKYLMMCVVVLIFCANKLAIAKYLIKDLPRFDPSRPDLFESFEIPL